MVNQEEIDEIQESLLEVEKEYKALLREILHLAKSDGRVSGAMGDALEDSAKACKRSMIAFHTLATACCENAGVQVRRIGTASGGGNKRRR